MSYSSTYPSWGKRSYVVNLDNNVKENQNDLCSLSRRDNNLISTYEFSKFTNYKKPKEFRSNLLNNSKASADLIQFNNNIELSKSSQIDNVSRCNNIDKAQQFLTESGILGSNHLNHSRELITKTSRIHLDPSVQSQIRKTSLGLRCRKFGDHFPLTITRQKYLSKTTAESHDLRLKHTQIQVHNLKETIETETTKILILRAEVSKIKRALQDLIYANSLIETNLLLEKSTLCVFCQEESSMLSLHTTRLSLRPS